MEPLAACGRLATAVLTLVLAGPGLAQGTWYVDGGVQGPGTGTPTDPYSRIQLALDAPSTRPGDLILVGPGVYRENLRIDRFGVTLRSLEGPGETVVQARTPGSTLVVRHDGGHRTVVEGFTLSGGSGSFQLLGNVGGGVLLDATDAALIDCVVAGNRAVRGGGVAVLQAHLMARDLVVRANVAEVGPRDQDGHGGGLFLHFSPGTTLEGGLIAHNKAGRGGGIYAEDSALTLESVRVESNRVGQGDFLDQCGEGGGLYAFAGQIVLRGSDFVDNLASGSSTRGGGARLVLSKARIRGGSFVGNAAGAFWPDTWRYPSDGGGLSSECSPGVDGVLFEGNRAGGRGGAIHGCGRFTDCILRGNVARQGGGAWISSTVQLAQAGKACHWSALRFDRCQFLDNLAEGQGQAEGGGVCGPAYLEGCRLAGNAARGNGGGAAHASLVDCLVEGNTAASKDLSASTFGGGAYESYLERCVVRHNTSLGVGEAVGYGGGLHGGQAERTVFHANRADLGGGLSQAVLRPLEHLTLWGNQATYAGGGIYFLSPGSVRNSILWQNEPDCLGGVTQRAIVTWSDVQGGCPGLGNEDIEPCFWAPEVGDFHLLPGSPCIDSGDPLGPPDPDGSRADKGALPFVSDWCGSPVRLCEPRRDSAGCLPTIQWSGTPSDSGPDDFVVSAVDVRGGRPGVLLVSRQGGELPLPGGGTLCLTRPVTVLAAATSGGDPSGLDCAGGFAFGLPQALLGAHGLTAGETAFVQILYRDAGSAVPFEVGLTDALRFTVCP